MQISSSYGDGFAFDLGNTDRWPNRFFMYASTYYIYNNNRSNTSFTVDGVTIAEPDGLNGGTYATASRPFGISKEDWLGPRRTPHSQANAQALVMQALRAASEPSYLQCCEQS